jgi:hypothetical protein
MPHTLLDAEAPGVVILRSRGAFCLQGVCQLVNRILYLQRFQRTLAGGVASVSWPPLMHSALRFCFAIVEASVRK